MKKFITLLLAILLIVPVQSIFATTPQDGIYQGKGSGIGLVSHYDFLFRRHRNRKS